MPPDAGWLHYCGTIASVGCQQGPAPIGLIIRIIYNVHNNIAVDEEHLNVDVDYRFSGKGGGGVHLEPSTTRSCSLADIVSPTPNHYGKILTILLRVWMWFYSRWLQVPQHQQISTNLTITSKEINEFSSQGQPTSTVPTCTFTKIIIVTPPASRCPPGLLLVHSLSKPNSLLQLHQPLDGAAGAAAGADAVAAAGRECWTSSSWAGEALLIHLPRRCLTVFCALENLLTWEHWRPAGVLLVETRRRDAGAHSFFALLL